MSERKSIRVIVDEEVRSLTTLTPDGETYGHNVTNVFSVAEYSGFTARPGATVEISFRDVKPDTLPFLQFVEDRKSDSGKTTIWIIKNLNGSPLGTISWKGQWRKYCFFPGANTVFDVNCLKEILDFLEEQTTLHRRRGSL